RSANRGASLARGAAPAAGAGRDRADRRDREHCPPGLSRGGDPTDRSCGTRTVGGGVEGERSGGGMTDAIHLGELEERAAKLLPRMVYDYYAGGAHDEITLRENRTAFQRLHLHYHVLRDIAERSLETEVLGMPLSMPVVVAPTAFHQLATE